VENHFVTRRLRFDLTDSDSSLETFDGIGSPRNDAVSMWRESGQYCSMYVIAIALGPIANRSLASFPD